MIQYLIDKANYCREEFDLSIEIDRKEVSF